MKTIMIDDYLASLQGSKTGDFIYAISHFYRDYHYQTYGMAGIHTHDPSAIAYVIDPTLFTTQFAPIRVATESIAVGQTIMDSHQQWNNPNPWTGKPLTNVCLDVDSERLLALYKQRITNS
jgi:inosine-uridine nucleoside N-ribohydrolase